MPYAAELISCIIVCAEFNMRPERLWLLRGGQRRPVAASVHLDCFKKRRSSSGKVEEVTHVSEFFCFLGGCDTLCLPHGSGGSETDSIQEWRAGAGTQDARAGPDAARHAH